MLSFTKRGRDKNREREKGLAYSCLYKIIVLKIFLKVSNLKFAVGFLIYLEAKLRKPKIFVNKWLYKTE